MTRKSLIRWFIIAPFFGACLYAILLFYEPHTESFKFIKCSIKSSNIMQAEVGSVENVSIDPIGGYSDKFVGSDHFVHMAVDVKGIKGEATVHVFATKTNGIWLIRQATINGRIIDLTNAESISSCQSIG